jgi:hypothetical protein
MAGGSGFGAMWYPDGRFSGPEPGSAWDAAKLSEAILHGTFETDGLQIPWG